MSPSDPHKPEETLMVAVFLTSAGGFLDAYTYVGHGGVFANAMTGNVVLMAIGLAQGAWHDVFHYLRPLGAYLLGIVVAHLIKYSPASRIFPYPARMSLGLEILFLLLVAFNPLKFSSAMIVIGIAFVAAMQGTSFTRLEGFVYTSVTTTGNLRRMMTAFLDGFVLRREPSETRTARFLAVICTAFIGGAALGAFLTRLWHASAVLVAAGLLAIALLLCLPWNTRIQHFFRRARP